LDQINPCLFEKTGDYLETGFTGSNVADLILANKKEGIRSLKPS